MLVEKHLAEQMLLWRRKTSVYLFEAPDKTYIFLQTLKGITGNGTIWHAKTAFWLEKSDFFRFQKPDGNALLARHCPVTREALRTVKGLFSFLYSKTAEVPHPRNSNVLSIESFLTSIFFVDNITTFFSSYLFAARHHWRKSFCFEKC